VRACARTTCFFALQDKVGARTVEGRKLRRGVLKGSVVAFVTAGACARAARAQQAVGAAVRVHARLATRLSCADAPRGRRARDACCRRLLWQALHL
jgi:hypothetical protein